MTYAYFGDTVNATDHNWNTVGNWFSAVAVPATSSSSEIPGVPLGRLPNASTDYVVLNDDLVTGITSGTYSGTVLNYRTCSATTTWSGLFNNGTNSTFPQPIVSAGNFTGTFNNKNSVVSGGTFSGVFNWYSYAGTAYATITGGTFNCPITTSGTFTQLTITGGTFNYGFSGTSITSMAATASLSISGGTFLALLNLSRANGIWAINITGGTYSPPETLTLVWVGNQPSITGFVSDWGFAFSATFSPVITYVGFGDILGAGLL